MINIILMGGDGKRFSEEGYELPKPLIEVDGDHMMFKAIDCLPEPTSYVFLCKREHQDKFGIADKLTKRYPNSKIILTDETTCGQACSLELVISRAGILNHTDILVSSCDYGIEFDHDKFEELKNRSDVVIFSTINNKNFSDSPESYSWLEAVEDNFVEAYVKTNHFEDPFNNHAIVGTFYYRDWYTFISSMSGLCASGNPKVNGEYYIDSACNYIPDHLKVKIFDVDEYHCWGTPKDLKDYEDKVLG
tara:strand:- start:4686 stop:5429 length:744 start_codon:yes stop_codon:yes gene_type:complete